ncbi:hypothetical protein [Desulfobotulus sp.]|uniref:hypothetical protein n=1 Tax=Desulfobotulus sp. TaxID=1940337 RepID=UPI002A36766C|nr:hypothetical protein [Desulfobotulus sp.]MDY0164797.1 hypothetical protein [Desulfobotulus sp.]
MRIYYDQRDCFLEATPQALILREARLGLTIHTFPPAWTPDLVWEALSFANKAYDLGYDVGQRALALHIKSKEQRQGEAS